MHDLYPYLFKISFVNLTSSSVVLDLSSSRMAPFGTPRDIACSFIRDAHVYFQTSGPPANIILSFLAHPSLQSLTPYSTRSVSSPASTTITSAGFISSL